MVNQLPDLCKIWPNGSQTATRKSTWRQKLFTRRNKLAPFFEACLLTLDHFLYLWGILIENGAKRRKKTTLMILAYGSAENVNNRLLGLLSSSILRVYSPLPFSWVILFTFSVCFWGLKGCVLIKGGAKRRKNQLNHFSPRLDDGRHFKLCW